jgi:hypothetical protein
MTDDSANDEKNFINLKNKNNDTYYKRKEDLNETSKSVKQNSSDERDYNK